MPIISITMGKSSSEKKEELIQKLTETAVEVTKIPQRLFTILISELPEENIGIGGQNLIEFKKSQ